MSRALSMLLLCVACSTPTPPPAAQAPEAKGDLRIQVVRLEYGHVTDMAKALEKTLAGIPTAGGVTCKVAAQPDHNALVVSGTTEQVREVLEAVARLDYPSGR